MAVFFCFNQYCPDVFMFFMSRSMRPVSTINRPAIYPLAKRQPNVVLQLRRADSGPRLDDGGAKAQPAMVLISKRLRKRSYGFKSHLTDWEKPGIKPGPTWFTGPGLQGKCYRRRNNLVCGRVRWL